MSPRTLYMSPRADVSSLFIYVCTDPISMRGMWFYSSDAVELVPLSSSGGLSSYALCARRRTHQPLVLGGRHGAVVSAAGVYLLTTWGVRTAREDSIRGTTTFNEKCLTM